MSARREEKTCAALLKCLSESGTAQEGVVRTSVTRIVVVERAACRGGAEGGLDGQVAIVRRVDGERRDPAPLGLAARRELELSLGKAFLGQQLRPDEQADEGRRYANREPRHARSTGGASDQVRQAVSREHAR